MEAEDWLSASLLPKSVIRLPGASGDCAAKLAAFTTAPVPIGDDGTLTLLASVAGTANLPNDLAVAQDEGDAFLYALNAGNGTVGARKINRDGSLTALGTFAGLPALAGAQGLVAY